MLPLPEKRSHNDSTQILSMKVTPLSLPQRHSKGSGYVLPGIVRLHSSSLVDLAEWGLEVIAHRQSKGSFHPRSLGYLGYLFVRQRPQIPNADRCNRYRFRFLLKGPKEAPMQAFIGQWLTPIKRRGSIRLSVDIDPYSFM